MAMRSSTAHSVVLYMKMGMGLRQAARQAMKDLRALAVPFPPGMNLVAMDRLGHHVGFTTETDRWADYVYQTGNMQAPKRKKRTVVPLERRIIT